MFGNFKLAFDELQELLGTEKEARDPLTLSFFILFFMLMHFLVEAKSANVFSACITY